MMDAGIRADLADAERNIRTVTGVDPRPWFRCPFNDGFDDPRVLDALARAGYRNVYRDVSVSDWKDDRTAPLVEDAVVEAVLGHRAADPCIVLLHSWPAQTLAALPGIISRLRAADAVFITVAEALADVTELQRIRGLSREGNFDETLQQLRRWLGRDPEFWADPWARSRIREVIASLALRSGSPIGTTRSLCAEIARLGEGDAQPSRGQVQTLLGGIWISVAACLAARGGDRRPAVSAAARAVLNDPGKLLAGPGSLRSLMGSLRVSARPGPSTEGSPAPEVLAHRQHSPRRT
jgi:hypothetical protein